MTTLFFTFRTVPQATLDLRNTYKASGTIEKVFEAGSNDVVFKLKDDERMYYLDLGRDPETSLVDLKQEFTGKPVEIYYEKQWTSPPERRGFHHIARVNLHRTVLFSETSW